MASRSKIDAERQQHLRFPSWGGPRKGSGRKPLPKGKRSVPHRERAPLASRFPVHCGLKLVEGLPSLRRPNERKALISAFAAGSERNGFRLVHYSIQSNHLHLIVEASNRIVLARGMQGLAIRIARSLNRVWGRKGKVFRDRYHSRILKAPRDVRNTLIYVLKNARRHGIRLRTEIDPYSSGKWFDGWARQPGLGRGVRDKPVAEARSWLLTQGWREKYPLIGSRDRPVGEPPG